MFDVCPKSLQPDLGQGMCLRCPGGLVSHPGSFDLLQCIDPAPNFAIAYMALAFIGLLAIPYLYLDRFRQVAFFRSNRVFKPLEALAGRVSVQMTLIVTFCSEMETQVSVSPPSTLWSLLRVTIFLLVGTIIAVFVMLFAYSLYLAKKMFSALLVWRGLGLDNALTGAFALKLSGISATLDKLGATPVRH